jgi:hypothetical protein
MIGQMESTFPYGRILPIFMNLRVLLISKHTPIFDFTTLKTKKGIAMLKYSMERKFGRSEHSRRLIVGYASLLQQRVKNDGWNPYLLTFMFRHLPGKQSVQLVAMEQAIVRFYSTLLTRIVRNPHSAFQQSQRPILIAAPDYPAFKHDKQKISDIATNDGLHMHGMLVVPWKSRMKEDTISHLQRYTRLYVKDPFIRINISEIEDNIGRVGDYVFKSIKTERCSWDDIIVLPKNRSEIRPTSSIFRQMVGYIDAGMVFWTTPPDPDPKKRQNCDLDS